MATPKQPSRLDRIETILDKMATSLSALAATIVSHDNQIEAHDRQIDALIKVAEKHEHAIANLERQWQAYINTLPRQ
jgi:hypothetical protein